MMAKGRKQSTAGSRTTSAASHASKKKTKEEAPEPNKSEPSAEPKEQEAETDNVETKSIAESDTGKEERDKAANDALADLEDQINYCEPSLTDIIVTNYDGNRGPTGLYDGYGEAHFVGGNIYKGKFENGQMNGKGIYVWVDNMRYEGDFLNNHITGYGMYRWPDGSSYEGEVSNGMRHGVGVFRSPQQGVSFSGQWYLGKRHGRGMMSYGEQSWYEGDWVNNARHGYGIRRYKTGNVFEGNWTNDKRHGEGTMRWISTNETYCGMWENGVQHGCGTHTWYLQRVPGSQYPLRNEYTGEFVNGLRHGSGKFFYASGAVYDGEWENGKKSGWGKFIFNNGRVFEGQFDNDHMVDYPSFEVSGSKTPDLLQIRTRTPIGSEEQEVCSDSLEANSTQISGNSLKLDIDTLLEDFPEQDRVDELKQVTHLALRNIAILKRAYTFYSALGHDQSLDNTFVMTRFQFWRFLKDCRVHHHQKSLFAMDRAIAHCHAAEDMHNPMEKMLMREFLSNIVILSHFIFKNDILENGKRKRERNFLARCLQKLLDLHVTKYSCNVKGYFLSEQRSAITALSYMDKCWRIYLAISSPNPEPPHDLVIKMRQFLFMLRDLNITGKKSLSAETIVKILSNDDPNVGAEGACNLELDMTFLEFFEALIGCAMEIKIEEPQETQIDFPQRGNSEQRSSPTTSFSNRHDESRGTPTRSLSAISQATLENASTHPRNSFTDQTKCRQSTDMMAKSSASQVGVKKDIVGASTGALLQTLSQMSAKDQDDAATNQDDATSEVEAPQDMPVNVSREDQEYSAWAEKLHYFFHIRLFPAWDEASALKAEAARFRQEEIERQRIEAIEKEQERRRSSFRVVEAPEDHEEDVDKATKEEKDPEPEVTPAPPVAPTHAPEQVSSTSSMKGRSGKNRRK